MVSIELALAQRQAEITLNYFYLSKKITIETVHSCEVNADLANNVPVNRVIKFVRNTDHVAHGATRVTT